MVSICQRLMRELQIIHSRLDEIERTLSNQSIEPIAVSESALLRLPDHLRKSFIVVAKKGECCATEVSNLTGRVRAIESNYLNQLVRSGWLNKKRESKIIVFTLVSKRVSSNGAS